MLDENKTDGPRSWALDPGVARALKMWKEASCKDAKVDDHVFVDPVDGAPLYTLHLADQLREDLRASGVARPALFTRAARTWAELGMGPLSPLDDAIPELRLPHGCPTTGPPEEAKTGPNFAEREGFEPSVPLRVHMISKLETILTIRGESRKQAQPAIRDRTRSTDPTMAGGNPVAIPGAPRSSNRPSRT